MKFVCTSLALLFMIACGHSSSHNKKPTDDTQESDADGSAVVNPDDGVKEETGKKSPAVGVYLGSCEKQGSIGVASGVEITATEIRPVTAVFGDQTCAKSTLSTFGFTGSFASFAEYANYLNSVAQANGDGLSASFLDTTLTFASDSGHKLSLVKTDVALLNTKRLRIFVSNESYDKASGIVKGRVNFTNNILSNDQWDLGFYCKKDGKLVRQESSFTNAGGLVDITAKLNSWNAITLPTTCQVTLILRQNPDHVTDLAYSQELPVN